MTDTCVRALPVCRDVHLGPFWFIRERHAYASCGCSYCDRATTAPRLFLWLPHWRYILTNGWKVLGFRRGESVYYWRLCGPFRP